MAADLCNSTDISLTAAPGLFKEVKEGNLESFYSTFPTLGTSISTFLGYWKTDSYGICNAEEQFIKEWNSFQPGLTEQMGRAPSQGKSNDWVIRECPVPFVDLLLEDSVHATSWQFVF